MVSLPSVTKAKRNADKAKAISCAKNLGIAFNEFDSDYDQYPGPIIPESLLSIYPQQDRQDSNYILGQLIISQATDSEKIFDAGRSVGRGTQADDIISPSLNSSGLANANSPTSPLMESAPSTAATPAPQAPSSSATSTPTPGNSTSPPSPANTSTSAATTQSPPEKSAQMESPSSKDKVASASSTPAPTPSGIMTLLKFTSPSRIKYPQASLFFAKK